MVVGQLPPYNWPQTQGPILILALNTDRSRIWSRGWMEDRSISRFVASSRRRVCSTFQPTKNQTFSVYYVAARSMQCIYMRFCSTCTLLCSPVFAIERMAKLQCRSIPFDRCCVSGVLMHARVKYRSVWLCILSFRSIGIKSVLVKDIKKIITSFWFFPFYVL